MLMLTYRKIFIHLGGEACDPHSWEDSKDLD